MVELVRGLEKLKKKLFFYICKEFFHIRNQKQSDVNNNLAFIILIKEKHLDINVLNHYTITYINIVPIK